MCDNHAPIDKLIAGFKDFCLTRIAQQDQYFRALVREGQNPRVLFLACSDSRVDPAIVFGTEPGDLFIIRNVANIVPPYESNAGQHGVSAAIEYAVDVLKVEHIIINGHSQCGGIRALCENPADAHIDSPHLVGRWLALAKPAYDKARADYPDADINRLAHECEKDSVIDSLANLMTFPMVREQVESGHLQLHGWYFDMARGLLSAWNPDTHRFEPLSC